MGSNAMVAHGSRNRIARFAGAFLLALAGCATGGPLVSHSFSFDAPRDSPGIEILDYRYGASKSPFARAKPSGDGRVSQRIGIGGAMLPGDDLYVKWRIKNSGEIYED